MLDMRKGRCPLCQHTQIIESPLMDYRGDGEYKPAHAAIENRFKLFSAKEVAGQLWLYICSGCGYTQHFVRRPDAIPIHEDMGTRLIEAPDRGDGPYR